MFGMDLFVFSDQVDLREEAKKKAGQNPAFVDRFVVRRSAFGGVVFTIVFNTFFGGDTCGFR